MTVRLKFESLIILLIGRIISYPGIHTHLELLVRRKKCGNPQEILSWHYKKAAFIFYVVNRLF